MLMIRRFMRGILPIIRCMAMESIPGRMEASMKASFRIIKYTVKVSIKVPKERSILEIGTIIENMAKV